MTSAPATGFHVLGPLEVQVDGVAQPLGGPKQRAILALLLINRNRVVSMDALGDSVWEDDPPPAVVSSVHVAISGLRRSLAVAGARTGVVLETVAPGYRLRLGDEAYDLAAFQRQRDAGVSDFRDGRFDVAAANLGEALKRWRGPVLSDLTRLRFAADFSAAMEEERLVALQLRIDADLLVHRLDPLLPELMELTTSYPLREHFWGQLATVLYGLNRQADALAALRRLRDTLDSELGIDPSADLQDLEMRILRQEVELAPATSQRGADLAATVGEPLSPASAELVSSWGVVYPVFSRGVRIGRSPDSDVVVADDRASRHHAQVRPAEDGFSVVDLQSRNGVLVNGRRVIGEQLLANGDVIRIGRVTLTLQVADEGSLIP